MNQRSIIEHSLKRIGADDFQVLMDEFIPFVYKDLKFESSPGQYAGGNKITKGHPDSFFKDKNDGSFVFAEYTTQMKDLKSKLKKDIDACLKINWDTLILSEIILAFTSKISFEDEKYLINYAREIDKNIKITFYSIQKLAEELKHFPSLGIHFPEISSFEGINLLNDFINEHQRGFRPNMFNPFVKSKEYEECLDLVKNNNICIICGKQGMGKSRLSVEVCKSIEEENNSKIFVITHFYNTLETDFKKLLNRTDDYVIIIDNFDDNFYGIDDLIQFFNNYNPNIKVVISVKNQFINKLKSDLNDFNFNFYPVNKLSDETLEKIIISYLQENEKFMHKESRRRLVDVSQGNPNLVMMGLYSAINYENSDFLINPIKIYDYYYKEFKKLNKIPLSDDELLTLGFISFFKIMNKNDFNLNLTLTNLFEFNLNEKWDVVKKLYKLELVDVCDNFLVKASDDVLKNYVFYRVFLKKDTKIINFKELLEAFIKEYSSNFKEILFDLYNLFTPDEFNDLLIPHTKEFKKIHNSDNQLMLNFYELFYILYQENTLKFIEDWVKTLKKEDDSSSTDEFIHYSNTRVISLLSHFYSSKDFMKYSLNLSLEIVLKQPSEFHTIKQHIFRIFTFKLKNVEMQDFALQCNLIDFLAEKENDVNKDSIKKEILLDLIPKFFEWKNVEDEYGNGKVMFYNFSLVDSSSLRKLRIKTLNILFDLSKANIFKFRDIFLRYSSLLFEENKSLYVNEKEIVYSFFENAGNNYLFSKILYKYIQKWNKYDSSICNDFKILCDLDKIRISEIYTSEFGFYNYDERVTLIHKDLMNKDKKDVIGILNVLKEIQDANNGFSIQFWHDVLFDEVINYDFSIFNDIFEYYIINFNFNTNAHFRLNFISRILNKELLAPKNLYNVLNQMDYPEKDYFNFLFFNSVPENLITNDLFIKFVDFINSTEFFNTYYIKDFMKFNKFYILNMDDELGTYSNIVQYIIGKLLNKSLFDIPPNFFKVNINYFEDNVDLLKKVYFKQLEKDKDFDYDLYELKLIASKNYTIIWEYVEFIDETHNFYLEDTSDLSFIWDLDISKENLEDIINFLIRKSTFNDNYLSMIFKRDMDEQEKVFQIIEDNIDSKENINIIFAGLLKKFTEENFIIFLEFLLKLNDDFVLFKSILLTKQEGVFSDLTVLYKQQCKFYRDIKNMIKKLVDPSNPFKYLEHKEYLDELIQNKKNAIDASKYFKFKDS